MLWMAVLDFPGARCDLDKRIRVAQHFLQLCRFGSPSKLLRQLCWPLGLDFLCEYFVFWLCIYAVGMEVCEGPAEVFNALCILANDDGVLDDEELLLLVVLTEYGAWRGLLQGSQKVPVRRLHSPSLEDETCLRRFRFTRCQLQDLDDILRNSPEFTVPCRAWWSGLFGLLDVVRRLSYPNGLWDLVEFEWSKSVLSLIFNTMLKCNWQR